MKAMKKLTSLLLVLMMVVSMMSITAWAATVPAEKGNKDDEITTKAWEAAPENAMATIKLPEGTTHTYAIYQIFVGDEYEGILSNVAWGANAITTGTVENALDEILKAYNGTDSKYDPKNPQADQPGQDTAQLAVIQQYVDLTQDPVAVSYKGEAVTVPTGYYLIVDLGERKVDDEGNRVFDEDDKPVYEIPENQTASLYMVEVVDDVTVTIKAGTTGVEKKIVEGDKLVDANNKAIGDTITYQITATLPDNYEAYKSFYLEFVDTLHKGLTYTDNLTVTANTTDADGEPVEKDVTAVFKATVTPDTVFADPEGPDGDTAISVVPNSSDENNVKDLMSAVPGLKGGDTIVITYTAKLNKYAQVGLETGNVNDVYLKYSNDPNHSDKGTPQNPNPQEKNPTGETPKDEVVTYTTELAITKIAGDTGNILKGAAFTLTSEDGALTWVLITQEVFEKDDNGVYWKLKNGTYTTEAPFAGDDETASTEGLYESTTQKYTKTTKLVKAIDSNATNPEDAVVVGEVDPETGIVKFTGLKEGKYTLTETKTPDGYNTIAPITFEIKFNYTENEDGTVTVSFELDPTDGVIGLEETTGLLSATVVNNKGTQLPSTGGIGTTIFYAVGGTLAVAAVILLITKRRMSTGK